MKLEVVEFADGYYGVRLDKAPLWQRLIGQHQYRFLDLEDRETNWRVKDSTYFASCCRTKERDLAVLKAISVDDVGIPVSNVCFDPKDMEIM